MPKHEAFTQALKELGRAQKCMDAMEASKDYEEFSEHWRMFLGHVDRAFNKLSYAGKVGGRLQTRIGLITSDRRNDNLLHYLMIARNVDEHGISEITTVREDIQLFLNFENVRDPNGWGVTFKVAEGGKLEFSEIRNIEAGSAPVGVNLIPVYDGRAKRTVDIPARHMGVAIVDRSPAGIGKLALKYYKDKITDLERL